MQIFAGFAWAGFQLSSGVFIFDAAPARNRTRYIALYNSLVFLGASVGALVGGVVTPILPPIMGSSILSIFVVSGAARLALALFFLRRIKEVRKVPHVEASELLFSDFQVPWIDRAYGYVVAYFRNRKTEGSNKGRSGDI
jgi:MFS family permease